MLESEEARRARTGLVYEYKEIQQMIKDLRFLYTTPIQNQAKITCCISISYF